MTHWISTTQTTVLILLSAMVLAACAGGPGATPRPSVPKQFPSVPAENGDARKEADTRFKMALVLMKEQRLQEAEEMFFALCREFPQFSGPCTDLGILFARGNQHAAAMAAFERAVAANPRNAVAYNELGVLYRQRGEFARAEQAYRKAIASRSGYADAHFNLAILYELSLKRPQQALTHYREYQRLAGRDSNPIVAVWVRELEGKTVTAAVVASATP